MQTQMAAFLNDANKLLCSFLKKTLPSLAINWWDICVVKNLSFHQRRRIEFEKSSSLSDLDLAALLRIFDKNWHKINTIKKFPPEAFNYVKEMQTVRNKWAHIGTGVVPKDDIFRDLDTLQRFIRLIKHDDKLINKIQHTKENVFYNDKIVESESLIQEPSLTDNIKVIKPNAETIKETRRKIRKHAGDLTSQRVYEEWLIYVLWHKFKGGGSKKEVTNKTIETMQRQKLLGDADFELLNSGETKASNTIAWGRNKLKDEGLISGSSVRGVWELTDKGIKKAQELPLPYKSNDQETDPSMPSHVAQPSKNLISKTETEYAMICRNKASGKNFIYLDAMNFGNGRVVNPKGKIMGFDKGLYDEPKEKDIDYLLSQGQIKKIQIERYKQAMDEQIPIPIKRALKQNVDNPVDLAHTKILHGRIGRESVTKWSELVETAHRLGFEHFGSFEALKKNSLSNIVSGIKSDKGFRYLQDIGISIQGENANNCWRNALHLAKKLKILIEISFEWRPKEGAANPGQDGKLFWSPST